MVNRKTVADFERGVSVPHDRTLRDLRLVFEEAGIELMFDGARGTGIKAGQLTKAT